MDQRPFNRLDSVASALIAIAWLIAVLSVIAGLVLMSRTEVSGSGFSREETHPFVWFGVSVTVGGILQALLLGLAASWAAAWAEANRPAVGAPTQTMYLVSTWSPAQLEEVKERLDDLMISYEVESDELIVSISDEPEVDSVIELIIGEHPD